MDITIKLDDAYFHRLCATLGIEHGTDLGKLAITGLDWMVTNRLNGRVILSASPEGKAAELLRLSELDALHPESITHLEKMRLAQQSPKTTCTQSP